MQNMFKYAIRCDQCWPRRTSVSSLLSLSVHLLWDSAFAFRVEVQGVRVRASFRVRVDSSPSRSMASYEEVRYNKYIMDLA